MARALDPPPAADLQVLAAWAPELADTFVALSCDIALVVDAQGVIVRMAQHEASPIAPQSWVGTPWVQTTGDDSRAKVQEILADVAAQGHARRREINHPQAIGGPVPVAYSAVRLGADGPLLAIGHDLRSQVALQQRFVAAQEALERSYWNAQRSTGSKTAQPPPGAPNTIGAGVMSKSERASLGLAADPGRPNRHDLSDSELVRALGRLVERIGHDELPELLRDARRLAERHFLERALKRAGSVEALARSLGVSRRALSRRRKT